MQRGCNCCAATALKQRQSKLTEEETLHHSLRQTGKGPRAKLPNVERDEKRDREQRSRAGRVRPDLCQKQHHCLSALRTPTEIKMTDDRQGRSQRAQRGRAENATRENW